MGYPAQLADGTLVTIVSKTTDANGNEVFVANDGAKYTRSFKQAAGNDATTLYEYDESLGEKDEDPYSELRSTEGVSISDIHSRNRERAAEDKAEREGLDPTAARFGGPLAAVAAETSDAEVAAPADADSEGDDEA